VDVPVLVAGAGPVGLTLACELERRGVGCRIVDAAAERAALSRATDLHARSLELWDHLGIADAIVTAGVTITSVPLVSGGREVARLDFTGVDSAFPAAVSLPQRDLEELLARRLRRPPERGTAVTVVHQDGDGVLARVGAEEVRAGYVIACDGVHSGLRDALGIPFDGAEFAGRWAVMDALVDDWPYAAGELPVFLDQDGFWAMPLPDGRIRMFFRDDGAGAEPDLADGQGVLDRHVPGSPRLREADNRACFELHHRVARTFRAGRVLLAGDAAHVMTPVTGQGMNTGVQDVFNLAWKLELALASGSTGLIDSYDSERRPVALAATEASTDKHDTNVLAGAAGATRDRQFAAGLATPAEVLAAVEASHELDVAYLDSSIVGGDSPPGAPGVLPGQRIPDAGPLVRADGTTTSTRQLLRDTEVQLWVCAGVDGLDRAIDVAERCAAEHVRARVFVIADAPPTVTGTDVLADPELHVHGRLGAVDDTAYVVRPDGYLGFRCQPPDAGPLAEHLRVLGLRPGG
jgi:2-polyprenyl-6-methoxyphenol hydroxylase-like FAD-dependent oxidoreductase